MNKKQIKTIDINAREWFDKINGNSYFSCEIVLNYGLNNEKVLNLPFQYGYGEHYKCASLKEITKNLNLNIKTKSLWVFCNENKIILRSNKKENCLKKELV